MKKFLIGLGHFLSIALVIVSVGLAIAVMVKPIFLTNTIHWLNGIIMYLGWRNYLLMGSIGFIESVPFINLAFPGQTFMILISGFVAQVHPLTTVLVVISACIIGDTVAYRIGRYKGESILRHYGPTFGLSEKRINKLKDMAHNHGHRALFASKWNSYTRGMLPFVAGSSNMKFGDFMLYNILGSIVYGVVIVVLSMLFIGHYERVIPYIRRIGLGIVAAVGIGYLISYKKNGNKTG